MRSALAIGVAAALVATAAAGSSPSVRGSTGSPRTDSPVANVEPVAMRPRIDLHGRVVLDDFCTRTGIPAVVFDHWRHRAMYTCRVCHVDLGFALGAGETEITAESNEAGAHCGACHDGRKTHEGRPIFRACSGWPRPDETRGCTRCHTGGDDDPRRAYAALARTLPTDAAGDIHWSAAVQRGVIEPLDEVEGVPVHGPTMKIDRNVTIRAKGTWLNNVTFSHRNHAVLNGCELCHPEIFPVTARNATRFRMDDVTAGQYCGVCHRNVAFPLDQCQRCHAAERKPMR